MYEGTISNAESEVRNGECGMNNKTKGVRKYEGTKDGLETRPSMLGRGSNQAQGIPQGVVDLTHEFRREPSEAADNLVPRYRGQGLTVDHTVDFEPGFASFEAVL